MECLYPNQVATGAYRNGCRCRRCKDAINNWQREYHHKHPKKAVGYYRKRKYGVLPEQFADMAKAQNGKCAICQTPKKLVLDHCHASGAIRGLLCNQCNTAVGLLGDKPDRALALAEYLKRGGAGNAIAHRPESLWGQLGSDESHARKVG